MYLYLVALHSSVTDIPDHNAPCGPASLQYDAMSEVARRIVGETSQYFTNKLYTPKPVGYTLVCSPTSLGTPTEALELYYSTLYCAPFSVMVHEFPFPNLCIEDEILALNPHKSSGKVTLQGQQTSLWSLGDPDDMSSASLEGLVAMLRAESDYAMQRHLWETRHIDLPTETQPKATPKTHPVRILKDCKGESWVVGSNSPLAAILDTPFCKEAKVTRLVNCLPFDGVLSANQVLEMNNIVKEVAQAVEYPPLHEPSSSQSPQPTEVPVKSAEAAPEDYPSRSEKVMEVAEAMWKIFEEKVVKRRPALLAANEKSKITKEAAQFLWLYLTKGIQFNHLTVPLDLTLTPFFHKIPEWWGDITTHMNLLIYFNHKTPNANTYLLREGALGDAIALAENFFGDNWAKGYDIDFYLLDTILYQPRKITEEEQNFLVRNFYKATLTGSSGEVLGSAEAYKEFQEWVSCAETRGAAAASRLPYEVGKEILAVMTIGQFGATMKRLGFTMKRRAQGNVYLDLAVKSKKKAVDALFKKEVGGEATCEGYGPTGPFEPQYAEA